MNYRFLGEIKYPKDLKKLTPDELETLCAEIRDMLVYTVSNNGGHLASNLGVVELTVALHRVFNSPDDAIIFDVGHQSYVHKLLTGRYDMFSTIRKENGISGFMRPSESPYDAFVTGHASNSVAAAYGIYKANRINGKNGTAIAVIGDGAMTGGLAFEALNNAGCEKGNFIIVVNDNKMSISGNVGSISGHLRQIRQRPGYYRFKSETEVFLKKIPFAGDLIYKTLSKIKDAFTSQVFKNNIFEALGFKYIGPVDGHNVSKLETVLNIAKSHNKPCVVHVVTKKGKGYGFAETHPTSYHGVSCFNSDNGIVSEKSDSFSSVCGDMLCEMAKSDKRICAVTAAMKNGTGLADFAKKYPSRFFDVGIAEEYAATFASGLASAGVRPYVAIYSTFLQRAYDQIIHDTAIASLPVCYLVDRAGIVGDDGETHQGVFDVAFLTTVPGMTVYSPAGYDELRGVLIKSAEFNGPSAIRYPRGHEAYPFKYSAEDFTVFGEGSDIVAVTYGIISSNVLEAREELLKRGIKADVIKLNKVYPVSERLIIKVNSYKKVYFFEEGVLKGGISEHISARINVEYTDITAIDGEFIPSMSVEAARTRFKLDTEGIIEKISGEK